MQAKREAFVGSCEFASHDAEERSKQAIDLAMQKAEEMEKDRQVLQSAFDKAIAEAAEREKIIEELRAALKTCIDELMYTSTTGHLWMWARDNTAVSEKLLQIRKLIEP